MYKNKAVNFNVDVTSPKALDKFMERVYFWTNDEEVADLFKKMYERRIKEDYYTEIKELLKEFFSINGMVDNDFRNFCTVLKKGDSEYDKVKECFDKGIFDVSVDTEFNYNRIEAVNDVGDVFLVSLY